MEALDRAAIRCDIVSGAGTGTYAFEGASGVWNELQVGSYVFMDVEYAKIGGRDGGRYTDFEHSLFVLATVMSVPTGERAILDAGLKSYSGEKGMPWVRDRPDLEVFGIADEHSKVRLAAESARLNLGDKLMLIPGHCDPTVNLHDWYVGVRNGRVEALWPIAARGASS
jgi:D-serine deaminase-like pyridoxal phosphate-dependent protein